LLSAVSELLLIMRAKKEAQNSRPAGDAVGAKRLFIGVDYQGLADA